MKTGILLLEDSVLDGPGTLRSSETFEGGSLQTAVTGATGERVVADREGDLAQRYVAAGSRLCEAGADILTANCGFAITYQDRVASASSAPVVLSSLLFVAPLARIFGGRLGVLTFDRVALDESRRAAADWPRQLEIPVADVQRSREWRKLAEGASSRLDTEVMRRELLAVAREFVAANSIAAVLLECTGMIPFRDDVRQCCGVAVFDLLSAHGLVRDALAAAS